MVLLVNLDPGFEILIPRALPMVVDEGRILTFFESCSTRVNVVSLPYPEPPLVTKIEAIVPALVTSGVKTAPDPVPLIMIVGFTYLLPPYLIVTLVIAPNASVAIVYLSSSDCLKYTPLISGRDSYPNPWFVIETLAISPRAFVETTPNFLVPLALPSTLFLII